MRHEVATRRVLYEIPGMRSVKVRDAEFPAADGRPLPMRIYDALTPIASPPPAVVLVAGYPDSGYRQHVGCDFMEIEWSISMAQIIAASGMTAITHSNHDAEPDALALMDYVRQQGSVFGVNPARVGVWAISGSGPVAIAAMSKALCGVLINPITKDRCPDCPVFVVRAGQDETAGLNAALDQMFFLALAENRPVTLVNYPEGPHAFDLFRDTSETRRILRQGLEFLRAHLV